MGHESWIAPNGSARVIFGGGSLEQLGSLARDLGARHVLLVTDRGVQKAGHAERAIASLRQAGIGAEVFSDVGENPTTGHVEEGVRRAAGRPVEAIVGLGGGSVMDCAKGINFILTNGGRLEDYWGTDLATRPMLPSIGIPTTAGTGSESQSYALIEQEGTRRKMACGDEKARFRAIILDPDLTATLPRAVAGISGLDALSHAVESYVTTRRNPISRLFALEAWRLLESSFETSLASPDDAAARGRMLLGAHLAGAAIESSMLGAAHACANPLTSRFEVPHGVAVLLTLPHVVRYNEGEVAALYRELLEYGSPNGRHGSIADRVIELRAAAEIPQRLRDCSIPRERLPLLAREASEQWTAQFNPRPVGEADLLGLYEAAY